MPGVVLVRIKTEMLSPERASCAGAASQEGEGSKPPTMQAARPSAMSNCPAIENVDSVSNPETDQPGKGQVVGGEAGAGSAARAIARPERTGEELGAFSSDGGGASSDFIPALIHVGHQSLGGGRVDLYRIAGRKDNESEVSARFSAVMEDERAREVLEAAIKRNGVDVSVFCCGKEDAVRAFVGEGTDRLFLNVHYLFTVSDWAEDDLPSTLAHEIAHVKASTPRNLHDHRWSVEFRRWVRSQDA